MYRLLQLLKRYYPLLLFIVLEVAAISRYTSSTDYSRAKTMAASGKMLNGVRSVFSTVGDWFSLGATNRLLLERLAGAEAELAAYRSAAAEPEAGEFPESDYFYTTARVINKTVNRAENFFIINKGAGDGVERNMAVIAADGTIVGYVEEASANFAVCMSILNRDFRIGGRIKGKDYIGSVFWEGRDKDVVTLSDIPRYADVQKGDTIVSAYSSRFPPDIAIGTVIGTNESPDGSFYWVDVRLGTDMARLSEVMLVKYSEAQELHSLEDQYFNNPNNAQSR